MLFCHVLPGPVFVDDEAFAVIRSTAEATVTEAREHLPSLAADVYLLVHQTTDVIDETGDGGYTVGPQCIRWDVDPGRDIATTARTHLRHTLLHECHHAVRLQRRPTDADLSDWPTVAVFEGLAMVFEREVGGFDPPGRRYDEATIAHWADELFAQPMDDSWPEWKFRHPDGRALIAYKVGAWLVDRAARRSGLRAADLVWHSPEAILDLAGRPQ